jgi:[acyl-carrier-protein] S-malonyltransferase
LFALRVAVVFPGQGTQSPAMGRPWKGQSAWTVVDRAEAALGEPLAPLLLDAGADDLARTRNSQLAVLLTSLMVWDAVAPRIAAADDIEIVAFAGHSLGQVSALVAAGTLSLDDGIRFAARRADLTQAAADAHPGRMAALLGATEAQAQQACAAAPDACWLANDNAPGQLVLAGTPDGLDAALARAKELGVRRAMALTVGGAFHTPLMNDAAAGLEAVLRDLPLREPAAPVVSNDDAHAYGDAEGWRARLARHVTRPVRWRESMETLAGLGATVFLEIGHGSMIAGVAKRTVPDVAVYGISVPEAVETLGGARS